MSTVIVAVLALAAIAAIVLLAKNQIAALERALVLEAQRVDNLITQMQANAQGIPVHPQAFFGPKEVIPEQRFITDETGLVVYEDSDNEDDFVEAATI